MKKRDIFVILIVLTFAFVGLIILNIPQETNAETLLRITSGNKVYEEIPLTDKTNEIFYVETDLGLNKVEIKDGIVRMYEADCPDQICVHNAPIDKVGEMIVCLPNQVIVEIISTV